MANLLRRMRRGFSATYSAEADARLRTKSSIAIAIDLAGLHRLMQRYASERRILEGKCCHGASIRAELQDDTLTSNILINLYCKCGLLREARRLFDRMPERSIVSWNSMIAGLVDLGEHEEGFAVFSMLHREGIPLSEYSLSTVLRLCASNAAISPAMQLHSLALKTAIAGGVYVGTALLDVYAKCGAVESSRRLFHDMPERSSVTWSSMVAGLAQNQLYEESLQVFQRAQRAGTEYTEFTFSAALSACASMAAATGASQLHTILVKTGLELHLFVATSLVDLYSRCGRIREAYLVFSLSERRRSVAVWNAMIAGFSKHGRAMEALILLEKMKQSGSRPNEVSYASALSAMGRAGSVEEARRLFSELQEDEAVCPNELHYSCMVDALGRSGRMKEAWEFMQAMPFPPTAAMWGSLLGSCKIHGLLSLAKHAAGHLFQMEPGNAGNHVLLSNIFAAGRRWDEVAQARKVLKNSSAKKEPGMSWIEIQTQVHSFVAGHRRHPWIDRIHGKLAAMEEAMREFAGDGGPSRREEEEEELVRYHSEKLALAMGLLWISPEKEIVIYKNLRVCGHCHAFMKLASATEGREIVLRDTHRFHHFAHGSCSCGDFW